VVSRHGGSFWGKPAARQAEAWPWGGGKGKILRNMDELVFTTSKLLGNLTAVLLLGLAVSLYALPTIIAYRRKKRNRIHIAFWNIVFGWTIIAWAIMLVESFTSDDAP
jgi:hypothetical protein